MNSYLLGILGNRCPHCRNGKVFRGWYRMNSSCKRCGAKFDREPGYFLGAMFVAYGLGAFSTVPTIIYLVFAMQASLFWVIAVPSIQVALLNPILFKYSRLAWLHADYRQDPHRDVQG